MPKSRAKPRPLKKGRPFDPARRRYCSFCKEKVDEVDYKDIPTLRRFVSERGKIKSRRISGACRRHQRQVATAIKSAREMALLPYVAAVTGSEDGRGRRRPRG
jgi:small subunit ribosomal protein S18